MKIIPNFETVILCEHTEEYVDKIVTNLKRHNLKLVANPKTKKPTAWKFFRTLQTDFLFHNSFLPDVYLRYLPTHCGSRAVIRFAMKKKVLAIIGVYLCVCVAMEMSLLYSVLFGKISLTPVPFIPVLLLIFISLLSMLCQKIYSKKLLIQILQATSGRISGKFRFRLIWQDL